MESDIKTLEHLNLSNSRNITPRLVHFLVITPWTSSILDDHKLEQGCTRSHHLEEENHLPPNETWKHRLSVHYWALCSSLMPKHIQIQPGTVFGTSICNWNTLQASPSSSEPNKLHSFYAVLPKMLARQQSIKKREKEKIVAKKAIITAQSPNSSKN